MADEKSNVEKKITDVITPQNVQQYILGTKKNGQPRAVYDIVKDFVIDRPKKSKKKKKKHAGSTSVFPDSVSVYNEYYGRKKKKKKKKKSKYWHI